MKKLIIGLALLSSTFSFAGKLITKSYASDVSGLKRGTSASECEYSTEKQKYGKIKITLKSDLEALIHFSFEIPAKDLPLKDGYTYENNKTHDFIRYRNGKLGRRKTQSNNNFSLNEKYIVLDVSADLKDINTAYAIEKTKKGISLKVNVLQELKCYF